MKKILEFKGSDKEESVSQILNADKSIDRHIALSEIYNDEPEELLEKGFGDTGKAGKVLGEE